MNCLIVENQAFDRVHRLGQQKDVEIYRLIISQTVEARVLELQKRKVCQGILYASFVSSPNRHCSV